MSTQHRADLIARIQKAATLAEQASLVSELDAYDANLRSQAQADRELDLAGTVVRQTLTPVRTHEMHTASTDWIADFEAPQAGNFHQASMAEAAMWFGRTSPEVRADREEFAEQARGFMRRQASQYGEAAQSVYTAGLEYLAFLHQRQAASGLDQIQQTIDPNNTPKSTPLDPTTFDNFAPEVADINAGTVGTETSERAPLIQEILGEGGGQGGPEKPGGHSVADDFSGGYSEVPVGEPEQMAAQGSWDGRSVAISHSYSLDDFRQREAASGLDQIQQVVDPNNAPKTTPLDDEVAFPWLISPNQSNGGEGDDEEKDVEHSASRKVADGHPAWDRAYNEMDSQKADRINQMYADRADEYGPSYNPGSVTTLSLNGNVTNPAYYYNEGYHHAFNGHPNFGYAGRDKALSYGHGYQHGKTDAGARQASRKQADMFGNSDNPHAVPQQGVANTPETQGNPNAGFAEGVADGAAGNAPTFADNSPSVRPNVSEYTQGYQQGAQQAKQQQGPESIPSMGTAASKASDRFVKAAARQNPDFRKAYAFASKWAPGKPLVTTGSPEFESGLYAGIVDNAAHQGAWEAAHRRQARKDPRFAARIQSHAAMTEHLVSQGLFAEAGTSTDLDTMDADASPSPTGQTPINGPGTPPPLAGGMDAAAPGGPAPYNGAEPFGSPVVPTGAPTPQPGTPTVNDIPGGPMDGNANPATLAFRRQVQAELLAQKTRKG